MDALNLLVWTTNPWLLFAIGFVAGVAFAFSVGLLGSRRDA